MFVKDSPHLFYVDDAHVYSRKIKNTRIPKAYKEASHSFLDEPNITHSKGREHLVLCASSTASFYVHPLFIHTSCKSISILLAHISCQSFPDPLLLCYFPRSLFQSLILEILINDLSTSFLFLDKRRIGKDRKNLSRSWSISCSYFWKQDISCRRKISCDKIMPCFALISYLCLSCPWKL